MLACSLQIIALGVEFEPSDEFSYKIRKLQKMEISIDILNEIYKVLFKLMLRVGYVMVIYISLQRSVSILATAIFFQAALEYRNAISETILIMRLAKTRIEKGDAFMNNNGY